MSTCSNCYSACSEITSDKCVKYTGGDISSLGISNGDSVNYVISTINNALVSALNGTGINYDLNPTVLCELVSSKLKDCDNVTVIEITNALSASICELDARLTPVETYTASLEATYTVGCLPGVYGAEGIVVILQAVIDYLCVVSGNLDALTTNVDTNYVKIADIDDYISNYISNNIGGSTDERSKMIPYTVVEYYGPLNVFDAGGAGLNTWEQIYLCNGDNGTPDKRGRVAIGTTSGMAGGAFPIATDPNITGNPVYTLNSVGGANTITLSLTQTPAHTHTGTTDSDGSHSHTYAGYVELGSEDGDGGWPVGNFSNLETELSGVHTHAFTTGGAGGGESHSNIQPVLACYYIMYIPTV